MPFQFQHATPFFIYGKGNLTAPALQSENIGARNAHHKALIEAALWYGTQYYSGTIKDSNRLKTTYHLNFKDHNIHDCSGNQNTLEYAWTCIMFAHRE